MRLSDGVWGSSLSNGGGCLDRFMVSLDESSSLEFIVGAAMLHKYRLRSAVLGSRCHAKGIS